VSGTGVLLSYAVLDDRLVVWKTTTEGTTSWVERLRSEELERIVEGARRELSRDSNRRDLERLYDLLVRRALDESDADALTVVPDRCLYAVPFAALRDRRTGHFLIEHWTLVVAPSVALAGNGPTIRASDKALVVAVSDPGDPELRALPHAEQEARAIARLYPSVLLTGSSATKDAFLARSRQATIVHFAGHARVSPRSDALSHLLLTPVPGVPGSESLLASEISSQVFPAAKVVVLAACSTGTGPVYLGEGPLSLARSFLTAGVPTVVASLWDVDDRSASDLLVRFHDRLSRGEPAAEALRRAQLAMIADRAAFSGSAEWAAFEVFGKG
jgi:CHAT domain-containing protein